MQPDHICKLHKINRVSAYSTIPPNLFNQTILNHLLWTVGTNLSKKKVTDLETAKTSENCFKFRFYLGDVTLQNVN